MSWLYSQALVEEYLGANSLDGEPSVQSSGNHTQQAYCAPDKMTECSRLSRFGMMFKPLTEDLGEELLMSYLAAFHAKTSPQPEREQESTGSGQECGEKWQGSFTKYDPDSSSWRTHQCLFQEESTEYLGTWPKWGLMRDGECWERTPLDIPITELEFGWLPTPVASDWKGGCKAIRKDTGKPRTDAIRHYIKTKYDATYPNPQFLECLMGWPEGWTGLKPLEMDKFQKWLDEHGS